MNKEYAEAWLAKRLWGIIWEDATGVHWSDEPWGRLWSVGDVLWVRVKWIK